MTTGKPKLSDAGVATLEAEISGGRLEKIREYVADAINYHVNDQQELVRRRFFVGDNCQGDADGVELFAILAVMTRDKKSWETALGYLGNKVDPALGYNAFIYLGRQKPGASVHDEWFHLLEHSRDQGHLQASRHVFDRRAQRFGLLGAPLIFLHRIWTGLRFWAIWLRNPKDRRLPQIANSR